MGTNKKKTTNLLVIDIMTAQVENNNNIRLGMWDFQQCDPKRCTGRHRHGRVWLQCIVWGRIVESPTCRDGYYYCYSQLALSLCRLLISLLFFFCLSVSFFDKKG